MKYFITEAARRASGSTDYFEFQKGVYQGACWKSDSIYLSAARWDALCLTGLFAQVFPSFDYCGITVVRRAEWEQILRLAEKSRPEWRRAMGELAAWAEECFGQQDAFCILGI